MKLGIMLGDVARSLVHRPVTERYPLVRPAVVEQLRGALWFNPEKCTGCGLCVKDCPAFALDLITLDKKAKKFVLKYHVGRCTFCAQCVKSCNSKCLGMSNDKWELAALDKNTLTVHYGNPIDVESYLAQCAGGDAGTTAPAET